MLVCKLYCFTALWEFTEVNEVMYTSVYCCLYCSRSTVMKCSGQDYKMEQHQNLVFMCHITEQHDYYHLGMFSTCENRFYSRLLQLFVHG